MEHEYSCQHTTPTDGSSVSSGLLGAQNAPIVDNLPAFGNVNNSVELSDEALRDLAIRIINAQEEERSRLGRDLHDDISQQLALFAIELDQLRQKLPAKLAFGPSFQSLQNRVAEMSKDLYRLSHSLHPSRLEHVGLASAVKNLCKEINDTGTVKVEFVEQGGAIMLNADVRLCIFRIAQEALRNCTKHSRAEVVTVALVNTGNELRLSVSDDGIGFDPQSDSIGRGLGFTSMRERVRMADGSIVIRSMPGHGTSIDVTISLPGAIDA
jgi:signal transduction histidine kinase